MTPHSVGVGEVMSVLVLRTATGLALARPSLWQRVLVQLRAGSLDDRLADGACPEDDVLLACRAQQLTRPRTRRWLAAALATLGETTRPPVRGYRPLLNASTVMTVRADLDGLTAALTRPRPLPAQGVAMATTLLRRMGDPSHRDPQDLARRLRDIVVALDSRADLEPFGA